MARTLSPMFKTFYKRTPPVNGYSYSIGKTQWRLCQNLNHLYQVADITCDTKQYNQQDKAAINYNLL